MARSKKPVAAETPGDGEAKRGRPKGSKTRPAKTVDAKLPRCRGCGGTDFKVLRSTTRNLVGVDPHSGDRYTSVVWQRAICRKCETVSVIRSLPFDPELWNAKNGNGRGDPASGF